MTLCAEHNGLLRPTRPKIISTRSLYSYIKTLSERDNVSKSAQSVASLFVSGGLEDTRLGRAYRSLNVFDGRESSSLSRVFTSLARGKSTGALRLDSRMQVSLYEHETRIFFFLFKLP